MSESKSGGTASGIGLRRFVPGSSPTHETPPERAATSRGPDAHAATAGPEEACEMCATDIPAEHGHVAELERSALMCVCRACYLLFTHAQAGRGRYRAVPDRYLNDPTRPLSRADWDALEVPVGLAFFLRRSDGAGQPGEVTGFYPSPAGATECRLDLQAWQRIAASHPMLATAAPDVEAILIYRSDPTGKDLIARGQDNVDCFLVPIDACYELAGRMRLHWRGFDGGSEARASIADFLDGVRSRSRAFSGEA